MRMFFFLKNFKLSGHFKIALTAWVSKIIAIGCNIFSIRIVSQNLGLDSYAVFTVLSSIVGWFMLLEFGLSSSLQNYISEKRARQENSHQYITNAFMLLTIISAVAAVCLFFVNSSLAALLLGKLQNVSISEKTNSFILVVYIFLFFSFSTIINKIWFAERKGFYANIIPAISGITSILLLVLTPSTILYKNLVLCLFYCCLPTSLLGFIISLYKFIQSAKKLNGDLFSWPISKKLLTRGYKFWSIGIIGILNSQGDTIIMTQCLKNEEIIQYTFTLRIFNHALFLYTSLLNAVWPVFAEKLINNNWDSVTKKTNHYLLFSFLYLLFFTGCFVLLKDFLSAFLLPGTDVIIPFWFILVAGIVGLLRCHADTFSTILYSKSETAPIFKISIVILFLNFALQYMLSNIIGAVGLFVAQAITLASTTLWFYPLQVKKLREKDAL